MTFATTQIFLFASMRGVEWHEYSENKTGSHFVGT